MALETYKKDPIKIRLTPQERKLLQEQEDDFNLPISNDEVDEVSSKTTRFLLKNSKFVFPLITGLIGIALILGELTPLVRQVYAEKFGNDNRNAIVAVSEPKVLGIEDIVISNPDSDYFHELVEQIENKTKFVDPPDTLFNSQFTITIPAIKADKFPITSNVDSYKEDEYRRVLEKTLAHFRGTSIPYQKGNSVIYGHSAAGISGSYSGKYIFSKLSNLKIGDEVYIDIKDKQIKYVVTKSKIVNPDDLSIIESTKANRMLTLVTCYPNGSSSKRMVVVAEEV